MKSRNPKTGSHSSLLSMDYGNTQHNARNPENPSETKYATFGLASPNGSSNLDFAGLKCDTSYHHETAVFPK